MNPIFDKHCKNFKEHWKDARFDRLKDGSFMVHIPVIELPPGWNNTQTSVYFQIPVGYPVSKPDCFWTDLDLRLKGGAIPMNCAPNHPSPDGVQRLWFSWHTARWNPNSDNLLTYVHVILNRFKEAR
jgi:hypothetical protein